jgi:hypothetical protein
MPEAEAVVGKAGSIYYISMKHFMTYNEAEFYPGSKFNVIIGPNGSGKSSVVTAITIGLGGDLSLLKRQKKYEELVNNEAGDNAKAVIKIMLYKGKFIKTRRACKLLLFFFLWRLCSNTAFLANFTMLSAFCTITCSLARQPCVAALPGNRARQPCPKGSCSQ